MLFTHFFLISFIFLLCSGSSDSLVHLSPFAHHTWGLGPVAQSLRPAASDSSCLTLQHLLCLNAFPFSATLHIGLIDIPLPCLASLPSDPCHLFPWWQLHFPVTAPAFGIHRPNVMAGIERWRCTAGERRGEMICYQCLSTISLLHLNQISRKELSVTMFECLNEDWFQINGRIYGESAISTLCLVSSIVSW